MTGFMFVALAAALWGSDALFRVGLALELPASAIVFVEHAILVVVALPFLAPALRVTRSFDRTDWATVIVIGAGASALATALFTQAFIYGDPTTPLLLQKLQPVFAIVAAHLILREQLLRRFALYFMAAMVGAYLMTFPDPFAVDIAGLAPAALAVGAALLWGLGTVLGRRLSPKIGFVHLTTLRVAIGLPASGAILVALGEQGTLASIGMSDSLALLLLALIPGLAALLIYYRGLKETPASAATLAELAFPLSALAVNYLAFDAVLGATQWLGLVVLATTIVLMARASTSGHAALGVVRPRASQASPAVT